MTNIKHVGRMIKNQRRVVVAYKVIPGEPESCIVIPTESLTADEHDALMKVVESSAGQSATELATVISRSVLPDGRPMLAAFHTTGKLLKESTVNVEMVPNRNTSILLSELNELIAQQAGVSVEDLAIQSETAKAPTKSVTIEETADESLNIITEDHPVLSDDDLAKKMRSQADALFKEAQRLRKEAEELSPTKKKAKAEKVSE